MMKEYLETEKQDLRRRRRERYIIASLIVVIIFLLTLFCVKVFDLAGLNLPISDSILIFSLININVILLLALLFLTMRNLVKLLFERRKKIMGARLRTKLVLALLLSPFCPPSFFSLSPRSLYPPLLNTGIIFP